MAEMQVIARIHSDFPTKFGVPRQSGLAQTHATIVFEPAYRSPECVRGMEGFTHIWLIWLFSENAQAGWSPTVRPPKLGGNKRVGVFATRSPFRPNPIGLSCVQLERVEMHPTLGPVIHVRGADLVDGTPILDIKPYIPYADCQPQATGSFTDRPEVGVRLSVDFPPELLEQVPPDKRQALVETLSQDPRPGYQRAPERVYGVPFAGLDVRFTVRENVLTVCEVRRATEY